MDPFANSNNNDGYAEGIATENRKKLADIEDRLTRLELFMQQTQCEHKEIDMYPTVEGGKTRIALRCTECSKELGEKSINEAREERDTLLEGQIAMLRGDVKRLIQGLK